jgi:hypothetical protein
MSIQQPHDGASPRCLEHLIGSRRSTAAFNSRSLTRRRPHVSAVHSMRFRILFTLSVMGARLGPAESVPLKKVGTGVVSRQGAADGKCVRGDEGHAAGERDACSVRDSIRMSTESASKSIDESDLQCEKHSKARIST